MRCIFVAFLLIFSALAADDLTPAGCESLEDREMSMACHMLVGAVSDNEITPSQAGALRDQLWTLFAADQDNTLEAIKQTIKSQEAESEAVRKAKHRLIVNYVIRIGDFTRFFSFSIQTVLYGFGIVIVLAASVFFFVLATACGNVGVLAISILYGGAFYMFGMRMVQENPIAGSAILILAEIMALPAAWAIHMLIIGRNRPSTQVRTPALLGVIAIGSTITFKTSLAIPSFPVCIALIILPHSLIEDFGNKTRETRMHFHCVISIIMLASFLFFQTILHLDAMGASFWLMCLCIQVTFTFADANVNNFVGLLTHLGMVASPHLSFVAAHLPNMTDQSLFSSLEWVKEYGPNAVALIPALMSSPAWNLSFYGSIGVVIFSFRLLDLKSLNGRDYNTRDEIFGSLKPEFSATLRMMFVVALLFIACMLKDSFLLYSSLGGTALVVQDQWKRFSGRSYAEGRSGFVRNLSTAATIKNYLVNEVGTFVWFIPALVIGSGLLAMDWYNLLVTWLIESFEYRLFVQAGVYLLAFKAGFCYVHSDCPGQRVVFHVRILYVALLAAFKTHLIQLLIPLRSFFMVPASVTDEQLTSGMDTMLCYYAAAVYFSQATLFLFDILSPSNRSSTEKGAGYGPGLKDMFHLHSLLLDIPLLVIVQNTPALHWPMFFTAFVRALTSSSSGLLGFVMFLLHLVFLVVAFTSDTSLMCLAAVVGIMVYVCSVGYRVFGGSFLFPLMLTFVGLSVLGAAVFYQTHSAAIVSFIKTSPLFAVLSPYLRILAFVNLGVVSLGFTLFANPLRFLEPATPVDLASPPVATLKRCVVRLQPKDGLVLDFTVTTDGRSHSLHSIEGHVESARFWPALISRYGTLVSIFKATMYPLDLQKYIESKASTIDVNPGVDTVFSLHLGDGWQGTQKISHPTLKSGLGLLNEDFNLVLAGRTAAGPVVLTRVAIDPKTFITNNLDLMLRAN